MTKKQSWIAIGSVIGGLAGIVVKLTAPDAVGLVLGPVVFVSGLVVGAIVGNKRS